MMGHMSDAVDKYQVTGHQQRLNISEVLQFKPSTATSDQCNSNSNKVGEKSEVKMCVEGDQKNIVRLEKSDSDQTVGDIINHVIKSHTKKGRTAINIKIEINHDD